MQHSPGPFAIRARQGAPDLLHDAVAHRIGMANPFAFDDFDVEIRGLGPDRLLDVNRTHLTSNAPS
jgi:hypothetical protein